MKYLKYTFILLALSLLAACSDSPLGPIQNKQKTRTKPVSGKSLGLMAITISGIGSNHMSASAKSVSPRAIVPGTAASLTPVSTTGEGIQIKAVSHGSFTVGASGPDRTALGYRYFFATFKVRNAEYKSHDPYTTARHNLTFLAVDTKATDTCTTDNNCVTFGHTAVSVLTSYGGTPFTGTAAAAVAKGIVPTGMVHRDGNGNIVSTRPDVLQAFTKDEVQSLSKGSDIDDIFPYGFIVRNPNNANSRTLPASPGSTDFSGLVTFAFKIPLQATASDDPFNITMMFLAVDDPVTRITRSIQEADDGGEQAFEQRASDLNAKIVTLIGNTPAYNGSSHPRVLCQVRYAGIPGSTTQSAKYIGPGTGCSTPKIYYVDENAAGSARTGASWANAFNYLQDALAVANTGDQIWVAEGTYTPKEDVGTGRTQSFKITGAKNGIKLYGGFDPADGIKTFTQRDPRTYRTILSGDIDGDGTENGNSYHVLVLDGTGSPITNATVIDGFTITGGNANGTPPSSPGSGSIDNSSGGGFYCNGAGSGSKCNPVLRNVTFIGNSANDDGGAVFNVAVGLGSSSSPVFTNVIFKANTVTSGTGNGFGGAMFNGARGTGSISRPRLTNVVFISNVTDFGGAICNEVLQGGAVNPTLTNVTFTGNSANSFGGAIYNLLFSSGYINLNIINSILWDNSAADGGKEIYNGGPVSVTISYSDVEGSGASDWYTTLGITDGGHNLDVNPKFVNGTGILLYNAHLQTGSPAIDAGNNSAVTDSPDLDGNPRIVDGNGDGIATVDMGAYEKQ